MSEKYNAADVEPRWQKIWDEQDVFRADDNSEKPKFYALEMFPCLLYTSPSPRDLSTSRMPSSA